MPAPPKPPLLYVLAAFGLVLGSFGTVYSLTSAAQFLLSRDQYVAAVSEQADKMSAELPGRVEIVKLQERQAEVIYARRGVAVPLAAMNFILSALLFAGAARAIRGYAWGVSAFGLAAAASVPYTLLALAFSMVETREVIAMFRETPGSLSELSVTGQHLKMLLVMLKTTAELIYFAACWLYLRRPSLRKLFVA